MTEKIHAPTTETPPAADPTKRQNPGAPPNTLHELLGDQSIKRHVIKIAQRMEPDPSKFVFKEYRQAPGACACGQKINRQFVLRGPDNTEMVIGSTCIDATVPFLIAMGAEDLAEAIRTQWKQVLTELRKQKQYQEGRKKLCEQLPTAAALEAWFAHLFDQQEVRNAFSMSFYLRSHLTTTNGETPAKRAALVRARILNFRERLPLLKAEFKRQKKMRYWREPPSTSIASEQWLQQWEMVEELREAFTDVMRLRKDDLPFFDQAGVQEMQTIINAHPSTQEELDAIVQTSERLVHLIPTPEEVAAQREAMLPLFQQSQRELKKAETTFERLVQTYLPVLSHAQPVSAKEQLFPELAPVLPFYQNRIIFSQSPNEPQIIDRLSARITAIDAMIALIHAHESIYAAWVQQWHTTKQQKLTMGATLTNRRNDHGFFDPVIIQQIRHLLDAKQPLTQKELDAFVQRASVVIASIPTAEDVNKQRAVLLPAFIRLKAEAIKLQSKLAHDLSLYPLALTNEKFAHLKQSVSSFTYSKFFVPEQVMSPQTNAQLVTQNASFRELTRILSLNASELARTQERMTVQQTIDGLQKAIASLADELVDAPETGPVYHLTFTSVSHNGKTNMEARDGNITYVLRWQDHDRWNDGNDVYVFERYLVYSSRRIVILVAKDVRRTKERIQDALFIKRKKLTQSKHLLDGMGE